MVAFFCCLWKKYSLNTYYLNSLIDFCNSKMENDSEKYKKSRGIVFYSNEKQAIGMHLWCLNLLTNSLLKLNGHCVLSWFLLPAFVFDIDVSSFFMFWRGEEQEFVVLIWIVDLDLSDNLIAYYPWVIWFCSLSVCLILLK